MTGTPPLHGLHHAALTVSELDVSIEWYARVLGFAEVARWTAGGLDKALLNRPDTPPISLVAHNDSAVKGTFDEHRAGLDHLSFAVADLAELQLWVAVLDQHSIPHGEIVEGRTGSLVAFRDPDDIALEFYTLV
ncbi:VOC family protein [Gordonia sp. PKS22-38]|uniref:VOC family protein n=1 Tax=Gordonia prachuapensis TaxID=3115651 RepID=A0ABU7MWP7_9ACTN|nr:VOC family protein [Gordonia sp. PKS22-38]